MKKTEGLKRLIAFSLIELLVSLIIISIIAALYTPVFTKKLKQGNISTSGQGAISTKCEAKINSNCKLCTKNICLKCDLNCASNQYKDVTQCVCKNCPSNCAICTENKCTKCNSGFGLNNGSCSQCSAGNYSTGAAPCAQCKAGTYSTAQSSNCTSCPAGTYSNNGAGGCQNCPAGTFSNDGAINCQNCPAGTYSAQRASVCQICQAGTFSNARQANGCSICPANTFSNPGASYCTPCPTGTNSEAGSASCKNNLKCYKGESEYNGECVPCRHLTNEYCSECEYSYRHNDKNTRCTRCLDDVKYVLRNGVCYKRPASQDDCIRATGLDSSKIIYMQGALDTGICVTKYNMGDGGIALPPGYTGITNASSTCTAGNYLCCWGGATANTSSFDSNRQNCGFSFGNYSGCNRTVCQFQAAYNICKKFQGGNSKSANLWRLPNASEMVLWSYVTANLLNLCDNFKSDLGYNGCPYRNYACKSNSGSQSCGPSCLWGYNETSYQYVSYGMMYGNIPTKCDGDSNKPYYAYSVRCVLDSMPPD